MTRPVPHSTDDEAALLGAALLTHDAARLITEQTGPADWWTPRHNKLREAIATLVGNSEPVDIATVTSQLARTNPNINIAETRRTLLQLQADCPAATNALTYLAAVHEWTRRRQILTVAEQLRTAAYDGSDLGDIATYLGDLTVPAGQSTWEPRNLHLVLDGDRERVIPMLLVRADGEALLYPGKVHAFNSSPGSGKSWLALHACAERLDLGQHVAYIDFEAEAVDIVQRLLELQLEPDRIAEQFHYIRPDEPFGTVARLKIGELLQHHHITLAVLDGLAEALAQNEMDENSASDVTRFYTRLPRLLAKAGAAVVILDHVVKDTEARGRYARGSTAKLAAIDGAVFTLDVITAFNRQQAGSVKIRATKDRHGGIKTVSYVAAIMHLTPEDDGDNVTVKLAVPAQSDTGPNGTTNGNRPTWYMTQVSQILPVAEQDALTTNEVVARVGRKREYVLRALDYLHSEGYVNRIDGQRGARRYHLVRPFDADTNVEETSS